MHIKTTSCRTTTVIKPYSKNDKIKQCFFT